MPKHDLEPVLEEIRDNITVSVAGQLLKGSIIGRYGTHFKIRISSSDLTAKLGASGFVEINIPYSSVEYWIGG